MSKHHRRNKNRYQNAPQPNRDRREARQPDPITIENIDSELLSEPLEIEQEVVDRPAFDFNRSAIEIATKKLYFYLKENQIPNYSVGHISGNLIVYTAGDPAGIPNKFESFDVITSMVLCNE